MAEPDHTQDYLLGERVTLFQPKVGFRSGMDAVLLAASLRTDGTEDIAEFGCGAGGALFCAAQRLANCYFTGFERDDVLVALARSGLSANQFGDRVRILKRDIAHIETLEENRFDQVFSNPPYFEPGRIRSPGPAKNGAYLADVPLEKWIKCMLFVAKPKGAVTLIHRAGAVAEILSTLLPRAGQIEILPIRSIEGAAAKRVLIRARKGLKRGDVVLHEGLTLHTAPGTREHTDRAKTVMAGEALQWA